MADEFYIEKKGNVGNSMLWWRKGNYGYSCDLKEACIFTRAEAETIINSPNSDKRMWPKEYIDRRVKHHVDSQYCNYIEASNS